ncbi:MAG: hypothetical protein ACWGSQ_02125, partial [Longimicrobiales bacterium]
DEELEELVTSLRDDYNVPPRTPREEMWSAIEARLGRGVTSSIPDHGSARDLVHSLEEARRVRMRRIPQPLGWAAAAAALLVLGLGIGRLTAPGARSPADVAVDESAFAGPSPEVLRAAAVRHLVQTESLLTLVRADARAGRVEPSMGSWARGLLSQTRLLMDTQRDADPAMAELLGDLELVLVQIVGAANADRGDSAKVRSELNLALDGMEEREVLPRIQAVVPAGPRFVGT